MAGTTTSVLPRELSELGAAGGRRRPAVSLRAMLLGLLGVVIICGLTPYNDYALNNTYLIGGNLPLGIVMLMFVFALLVNGPLSKWAPGKAFTAGEMTVAMSMALVACALPSGGFMRWWPASLIAPYWHARTNGQYLALMKSLDLPQWMLPTFSENGVDRWVNDHVIVAYFGHVAQDESIKAVMLAWVRPFITWGLFLFALYGALLCLTAIVRRQWNENERLPFPIAQIQLALVAQPAPGKFLNEFFRRRSFWWAFTIVFFLRTWNALARYWPQYYPEIPLKFDLTNLFTERPLSYVDTWYFTKASLYFIVVGITYFLSAQLAFSLWFFVVLDQIYRMILGTATGDAGHPGQYDEHLGALIAFGLATLWVGRRHWELVIKQALRGPRGKEPQGRYMSYRFASWTLLGCAAFMIGWLTLAGMSPFGAGLAVLMLLSLFMICARIIAETGFIHGQIFFPLYKPYELLAQAGMPNAVSLKTFYLSTVLQAQHYDYREVVPVYASHGMKVADSEIFASREMSHDNREDRRTGRRIMGLMLLALLVGYGVSAGSTLWTAYKYELTQDTPPSQMNKWGDFDSPLTYEVTPTMNYKNNSYHLAYSPPRHIVGGFGIAALLSFLRLRFNWWPLHPIGFLMLGTYPGSMVWFSVFVGWICKVLIVRFGGARAYLGARTFFLGLIVGESVAGGVWLIIGLVLHVMNLPYKPVQFSPG